MKRLFRISFDTLLISFTPILCYFLLGILVDKNLINIFSLVYPMQFVISSVLAIFGTGANIHAIRDKNKHSVFSGFIIGSFLVFLIVGIIALNIDKYISFMNMDISTYKVFAIYAVLQMFMQSVLNLILCKMYYENDNTKANKYSFSFNIINFVSLIGMSIFTKNQILIASTALTFLGLFTLFMIFRNIKITKFKINILKCIKYDSFYLFSEICHFLIFLFSFKNAFEFGAQYILAISFTTLITDAQWDMCHSVKTVAGIDITKKCFSYKKHIKNGQNLSFLLVLSSIILGLILYPFYKTNISATLLILGIELICLFLYPIYITKLTFIQLELSAKQATTAKLTASLLRVFCSFIPSPYCASIGLAVSVIYQLASTQYIIKKNKLNLEMIQH